MEGPYHKMSNSKTSSNKCRAKDPSKCRVHGTQFSLDNLNLKLTRLDAKYRPTIGLDLDGVTFQYEEGFRQHQMEVTKRPKEDFPQATDYSFVKSGWPFEDREDFAKAHAEAVEAGLYEKLETINGAVPALRRLVADGYKINVVTTRFIRPGQHAEVVRQTALALDKAGIPYHEISFTARKAGTDADVYVEDAPYNIDVLRAAGKKVIPFGQVYNKGYEGRTVGWEETEAEIRRIAPIIE